MFAVQRIVESSHFLFLAKAKTDGFFNDKAYDKRPYARQGYRGRKSRELHSELIPQRPTFRTDG